MFPWYLFTQLSAHFVVGSSSVATTSTPACFSSHAQYPTPAPTSIIGERAVRACSARLFGAAKAYRWHGHSLAVSRNACRVYVT